MRRPLKKCHFVLDGKLLTAMAGRLDFNALQMRLHRPTKRRGKARSSKLPRLLNAISFLAHRSAVARTPHLRRSAAVISVPSAGPVIFTDLPNL